MLDFLSNLALSASQASMSAPLSGADVVRPRLAARFEPVANRADTVPLELNTFANDAVDDRRSDERDTAVADRAPVATGRDWMDASPIDARPERPHPNVTVLQESDTLARLNSLEQQLREWQMPHLQPMQMVVTQSVAREAEVTMPTHSRDTVANQQDRDAAAPLTQATVGTQADESALATPRVQLSNAEDAGASVARRNTYADPATLPSKPQTPAPATSPLPSVTPRFIEMHVQPQLRAATTPMRETKSNMPAPVPTIHVSIGRIEVRAATQPSPNSRRSTAAPDKSPLDDYLGRRGNSKGEGR